MHLHKTEIRQTQIHPDTDPLMEESRCRQASVIVSVAVPASKLLVQLRHVPGRSKVLTGWIGRTVPSYK